jgi:hypothetical protein
VELDVQEKGGTEGRVRRKELHTVGAIHEYLMIVFVLKSINWASYSCGFPRFSKPWEAWSSAGETGSPRATNSDSAL